MSRVTFIVELDLPTPLKNAEEARYICASLELGIGELWHDYMVNEAIYPYAPKNVCVRAIPTSDGASK